METKVASIYFADVKAERPFGGPYLLPAVPLGADPAILVVSDRVQMEEGPYNLGVGGRRQKRRHLVLGEAIAQDIVTQWTMQGISMTPQCHPGIWVVRQRLPVLNENGTQTVDADGAAIWRQVTPDEEAQMWQEDLAANKAADKAYAEALFIAANAQADDARLIPFIAPSAKLGAKQYGYQAEWLRADAAVNVKPCGYCMKVINAAAIKCPHCGEVVNFEAYAELEAKKRSALTAATKELQRLQALERERLRAIGTIGVPVDLVEPEVEHVAG